MRCIQVMGIEVFNEKSLSEIRAYVVKEFYKKDHILKIFYLKKLDELVELSTNELKKKLED